MYGSKLFNKQPFNPLDTGASQFEVYESAVGLGGDDFAKAMKTANQVRFHPEIAEQSMRLGWDEPNEDVLAPNRSSDATAIGEDVFGPPTFHATLRNTLFDPRGEAAINPFDGTPAEGASEASWKSYALLAAPGYCGTCSPAFKEKIKAMAAGHPTDDVSIRRQQRRNLGARVSGFFRHIAGMD